MVVGGDQMVCVGRGGIDSDSDIDEDSLVFEKN